MTEAEVSRQIQLAASKLGCRLFRNTVGVLPDGHGRMIRFGLAVGSSDLIGFAMRGEVAIFLAVEVKSKTGRIRSLQQEFLEAVRRAGGIAILARSVDDFTAALAAWEQAHGHGRSTHTRRHCGGDRESDSSDSTGA